MSLSETVRGKNQDAFARDDVDVVVATVALKRYRETLD